MTDAEILSAATETGGDEVPRVWRRVVDGTSLITEDEVTAALRTVTGLPVVAPAPVAKEQKKLIGHPKP